MKIEIQNSCIITKNLFEIDNLIIKLQLTKDRSLRNSYAAVGECT